MVDVRGGCVGERAYCRTRYTHSRDFLLTGRGWPVCTTGHPFFRIYEYMVLSAIVLSVRVHQCEFSRRNGWRGLSGADRFPTTACVKLSKGRSAVSLMPI
ncbi:hypothetical protein MTBSS4_180004 [Magnetospirillum sp. SS-4]|nr:hypothetical protein MTBSS4_180004 [Magnetospirillum sp. SS-4]